MRMTEGAVLLVHGAWHGQRCWQDLARRLGDLGHDVPTVELRGHDQQAGRIWHRVQDYVEDVREAASMVLLAPVPFRGTIPAVGRLARRHPVALLEATLTLRLRPFVRPPAQVRELFFTATTSQETVDDTWRRLRDESYLAFLQTAVLRPRPARIQPRVLVVAAEHDWFFTMAEMQTARAYGTKAVVVEGAGHDLMLDSGWPDLARRIDHWTRVTVAAAS